MPTVHEIVTTLTARAGQFEAALKQSQAAVKRLETEVSSLHKRLGNTQPAQAGAASIKNQTAAMSPLIGSLKTLVLGYISVQAAIKGASFALDASASVTRQQRAWTGIAGSVAAGRKELEFVRAAANKLGVDFEGLEAGYRKIAASAKGTTLEGKQTQQIFLDISQAMSVLGASSDEVSGAMRALSQMISTGVVQADELRNELGNSLPAVMSIAARSMGMTTQEFRKLQEAGGVITEEFLPKFARMVKESYVPASDAMGKSTRTREQEFTRLWSNIKEGVAGVVQDTGLESWLQRMGKGIADVAEQANKLRKAGQEGVERNRADTAARIQGERAGLGLLSPSDLDRAIVQFEILTADIVKAQREVLKLAEGSPERLRREARLDTLFEQRSRIAQTFPPTNPAFPGRISEGSTEAQRLINETKALPAKIDTLAKERAAMLKSMEELGEQLRLIGKTPAEIAREQLKFLEKEYEDFLKKHQRDVALLSSMPVPSLPGVAPQQSNALAGEMDRIKAAAAAAGVDPNFLAALRQAENGRAGREFGVLSVPAPTYEDQARIAAQTIAANLKRFQAQGGNPFGAGGQYTPDFIKFFSSRYAPLGASNDPTNLNAAHASNLQKFYQAGAMPSMAAPILPSTPAIPAAPTLPAATGADPIRAKIDSLKEYLDQTEAGVDISQMAQEVDQRRAETLQRLLEQLDPVTTKEDALYRAIQLANAEKAADVGNTDAMAVSLENVKKSLDLGSDSLNRYERALVMKQVEQELSLMTDQTEAEAIRKKVDAYTTEAAALTQHKKKVEELTLVQKELAQVNEFIAEVDRRRPDEINNIIEAMRRGLPTLKEYEELKLRLQGLGVTPDSGTGRIAEDLRKQSDPAYRAMLDGADNFAANLQSTLIDALSGGKDAWKNFADFAIQEMLRILFEASGFRENMKKLLTEVASILANLLKSAGGAAAGAGAGATTGGDITQGGFGQYNMAAGGFLAAGRTARMGEAGRELYLSGGKMRLVGMHGPEIIRAKAPGFVIPHRQTMSIINRVAHRALGGPLQPGQSTLVGEEGMEAVMGQPNNKGGNTINVPMTIVLPNVQNKQEFLQNQAQLERAAANMVRRAMGRL